MKKILIFFAFILSMSCYSQNVTPFKVQHNTTVFGTAGLIAPRIRQLIYCVDSQKIYSLIANGLSTGSLSTTSHVLVGEPGTVKSVAATAGTGISIAGSPITSSGTLTVTNTAPNQTVTLTAGTGASVGGIYPTFTITNTSPSQWITGSGSYSTAVTYTVGNVGIGTTSPNSIFNIMVANPIFNIRDNQAASGTGDIGQINFQKHFGVNISAKIVGTREGTGTDYSKGGMAFYTNDESSLVERIRILNSGNVGIGTTAPTSLLHLKDGHIRSEQTTAPTVTVTVQNGITAAAITAGSTDTKGNITTTGTNNGVTTLRITFNISYTNAPMVFITPNNTVAAGTRSFVTSTTTYFELNFWKEGTTAVDPSWNYFVIE